MSERDPIDWDELDAETQHELVSLAEKLGEETPEQRGGRTASRREFLGAITAAGLGGSLLSQGADRAIEDFVNPARAGAQSVAQFGESGEPFDFVAEDIYGPGGQGSGDPVNFESVSTNNLQTSSRSPTIAINYDGSDWVASGPTGRVANNTDLATCLNSAISAANDRDSIFVANTPDGSREPITTPITVDKPVDLAVRPPLDAQANVLEVGYNIPTHRCTFAFSSIHGQGNLDGNVLLGFQAANNHTVYFNELENAEIPIQLATRYTSPAADEKATDNSFFGGYISGANKAIDLWADTGLVQGNTFHGVSIFGVRDHSVHAHGQKATLNAFHGGTIHGTTNSNNTSDIEEEGSPNGEGNLYIADYIGGTITDYAATTYMAIIGDVKFGQPVQASERVQFDRPLKKPITDQTLSSGEVSAADAVINVEPESGSSDTLTTITGGQTADEVRVRGTTGNTITVSDGGGNILLDGSTDFALDAADSVTLQYDGKNWIEVARADVN